MSSPPPGYLKSATTYILVLLIIISSSPLSSIAMRAMSTKFKVSSRIARTLDPCVVLMKELVGKYEKDWKDRGGIYSLAQGVVYWKPPESTTEALQQALSDPENSLHLYGPDEGLKELCDVLQAKVATENGLIDHHVMVTVGANQAYVNTVLTLLQDSDKAVVFRPYYFNHVMALQMTLPSQENLLEGPSSAQGIPDLEWLQRTLEQNPSIKMVTLVNPGNPTGTLLSRDVLQVAVDLCRQYGAWLVLDCTYEYFVPDCAFDGCFTDPHVIHIFSLSKAYALAGYRCGYIAIPRQADGLYDQMMKVQDTIPIAPSRISQIAALGALRAGKDWVKEKIETLDTGRKAITDAMKPLKSVMGGTGSMYLMGKLDDTTDDEAFARILVEKYGVAVIPGSFCGFPGWIRVCYANLPPEKCKQAAERLSRGLQELLEAKL